MKQTFRAVHGDRRLATGRLEVRLPFRASLVLLLLTVLAAFGCSRKRNVVVLLPDPDGTVGEVEISNTEGAATLDQEGEAVAVRRSDRAPRQVQLSQEKIDEIFGEALGAQPDPPRRFLLYFVSATELTDESKGLIPEILKVIQDRESVDTSVVGHTDTSGDEATNLRVSRQRAQTVADLLIASGVDSEILDVTGHGETNLLVPTADNVVETRNRRVVVTVR